MVSSVRKAPWTECGPQVSMWCKEQREWESLGRLGTDVLAFDLRSCSPLGDFQSGSKDTQISHTNFRSEISEWHRNAHSVVFIEKGYMPYLPHPKVESKRYSHSKLPVVASIAASEGVHIRMPTLCSLVPRKKEAEFWASLMTSGCKCCPELSMWV